MLSRGIGTCDTPDDDDDFEEEEEEAAGNAMIMAGKAGEPRGDTAEPDHTTLDDMVGEEEEDDDESAGMKQVGEVGALPTTINSLSLLFARVSCISQVEIGTVRVVEVAVVADVSEVGAQMNTLALRELRATLFDPPSSSPPLPPMGTPS